MLAHAPSQLLVAPLSFSKRYRVRPRASTRIRPSFVSRVLTVPVAVLGAARVAPYADPPPVVPDVEPPQPATTTAISCDGREGKNHGEKSSHQHGWSPGMRCGCGSDFYYGQ